MSDATIPPPTEADLQRIAEADYKRTDYYRPSVAEEAWIRRYGHERLGRVAAEARADAAERERDKIKGACPCLHTTPCDPHCTCIHWSSSHGCGRCCSYGSPEQQQSRAVWLAALRAQLAAAERERDRLRAEQAIDLDACTALNNENGTLHARLNNLRAFKDWVHNYLDSRDVPTHIDGPHSKEGCRIGDRMDFVFAQLAARDATITAALARVEGVDYREGHYRDNTTADELRDIVLGLAMKLATAEAERDAAYQ